MPNQNLKRNYNNSVINFLTILHRVRDYTLDDVFRYVLYYCFVFCLREK